MQGQKSERGKGMVKVTQVTKRFVCPRWMNLTESL